MTDNQSINQSINCNNLAKEFINETLNEGYLWGLGTGDKEVLTIIKQVCENRIYTQFESEVDAQLTVEQKTKFEKLGGDTAKGILKSEMSGTALQRAMSYIETGAAPSPDQVSAAGLFVEGLGNAVDISSETSQIGLGVGLAAVGIISAIPGGKIVLARGGMALAATGVAVSQCSIGKNAGELILLDNFYDNPAQAREEDWVDLGRATGNLAMFGIPVGAKAYLSGPQAIADDIVWTANAAKQVPSLITGLKTSTVQESVSSAVAGTQEIVSSAVKTVSNGVSRLFGNRTVEIAFGDITAMPTDAVVVPHFQGATSYGGVGGAVARSGATAGLENYEAQTAGKSLPWGHTIITPSGGGNAQQLVNVVTVGSGQESEYSVVQAGVFNALQAARERGGVKTISFPLLGTGNIGRLTPQQAMEAMLSTILRYSQAFPEQDPQLIRIVVYAQPSRANLKWASGLLSSPVERILGFQPAPGMKKFDLDAFIAGMGKDGVDISVIKPE